MAGTNDNDDGDYGNCRRRAVTGLISDRGRRKHRDRGPSPHLATSATTTTFLLEARARSCPGLYYYYYFVYSSVSPPHTGAETRSSSSSSGAVLLRGMVYCSLPYGAYDAITAPSKVFVRFLRAKLEPVHKTGGRENRKARSKNPETMRPGSLVCGRNNSAQHNT